MVGRAGPWPLAVRAGTVGRRRHLQPVAREGLAVAAQPVGLAAKVPMAARGFPAMWPAPAQGVMLLAPDGHQQETRRADLSRLRQRPGNRPCLRLRGVG
jgi:hypothetical protein